MRDSSHQERLRSIHWYERLPSSEGRYLKVFPDYQNMLARQEGRIAATDARSALTIGSLYVRTPSGG